MRDKNRIAYLENLWSVVRDFYKQEDYSFAQILDKAQITYYDEDSIAYNKLKNLINKEKPPFTTMRGKPPLLSVSVSGGMDSAKQYCKYWVNMILLM